MLDLKQFELLRQVSIGGAGAILDSECKGEHLRVEVSGCAYSCCGRGWERRDYQWEYYGYIDNLEPREGEKAATFMLYSIGLGTVSYVIAVRDFEVLDVEPSGLERTV